MPLNLPRFWKKRSADITGSDPSCTVVYLGNILTSYAKGEGCEDKPLATLWRAHAERPSRTTMELTVCASGLRTAAPSFGVAEYWAYRISHCSAPPEYPGVFCWIYRHERPKMRQELRCHAALCSKPAQAKRLAAALKERLAFALQEFRREKLTRQKARLSLANAVYDCPSMPRRKLLLYRGTINFRPPIEMSKIAPKLTVIDEDDQEDDCPPSSDDDLYFGCSEDSSLSSTPEEDEGFARFQRAIKDLFSSLSEDTSSNSSDDTSSLS